MPKYLKPFPDSKLSSKFGFRSLAGGTFHEGVDYRLPMRTPLPAIAAGVVVARGETKKYGRYVVVKADVGGFYRWHACDEITAYIGERVGLGETIALSGMSGFWSTGPHGHLQCTTAINPNTFINPLSVLASAASAGGLSDPFQEDDMFTDDDRKILKEAHSKASNAYAGVFNGAEVLIDGKVQKFNYGILPIVAHNQTLIAQLKGTVAALSAAVSAISGGTPINLTAIEAAAEKGAREALDGLTFKAEAK